MSPNGTIQLCRGAVDSLHGVKHTAWCAGQGGRGRPAFPHLYCGAVGKSASTLTEPCGSGSVILGNSPYPRWNSYMGTNSLGSPPAIIHKPVMVYKARMGHPCTTPGALSPQWMVRLQGGVQGRLMVPLVPKVREPLPQAGKNPNPMENGCWHLSHGGDLENKRLGALRIQLRNRPCVGQLAKMSPRIINAPWMQAPSSRTTALSPFFTKLLTPNPHPVSAAIVVPWVVFLSPVLFYLKQMMSKPGTSFLGADTRF